MNINHFEFPQEIITLFFQEFDTFRDWKSFSLANKLMHHVSSQPVIWKTYGLRLGQTSINHPDQMEQLIIRERKVVLSQLDDNEIEASSLKISTFIPDHTFQEISKIELRHIHVKYLSPSVSNCNQLTALNIYWGALERIPKEIGLLTNLCSLRLDFNNLKELPEEIGDCRNLELLWISGNLLKNLPASLTKLTKLKSFHADNNDIQEISFSTERMPLKDFWVHQTAICRLPKDLMRLNASDLKHDPEVQFVKKGKDKKDPDHANNNSTCR